MSDDSGPKPSGKLVTLIGTPLAQSFAARMQNAGYAAVNADVRYFYSEAGPDRIADIIAEVRANPAYLGAAVTKPNKICVMDLLDEVDDQCARIGACNTIVRSREGRLVGYNTDAYGFQRALTSDGGVNIRGASFFCVGAGGVARPVCAVLAAQGAAHVYVTDIVDACAQSLADDLNASFSPVVEHVEFGDFAHVAGCDVIVNAAGVGMGHTIGQNPLPPTCFLPNKLYYDCCYNPQKTQFLVDAQAHGARILNGLSMSLYQGMRQFEMWTGAKAPMAVMRKELLAALTEAMDAQRAGSTQTGAASA